MRVLLAILLCGMSTVALAGQPSVVYNVIDGNIDGVSDTARAWKFDEFSSYCNADKCVPFTVNASVAQWMRLVITSTTTEWRILKPGDYAVVLAGIDIQSNGNVVMVISGFLGMTNEGGDLIDMELALVPGPPGLYIPEPGEWIPITDPLPVPLPENDEHDVVQRTLWMLITVVPCDSACEYASSGEICVSLDEQKPWVDRETGGYLDGYPDPE